MFKQETLKNGDLIFADTAEDYTVGKSTEIYNMGSSYVVSGLHTIACRPKNTFACGFLGYYTNSPAYRTQLLPLMQGIKVYSISKTNLGSTYITYPTVVEQQKIADFLSLVDERIEKQRQLVEVLKRYKRGLLSLVFKGNFQMVKLADICDFVSSSHTISNLGARESGIYPVYDAAGLSMYIDTYDMHEEYISIVKDGSGIGRLQKCDKNSSFIGTLGALVAKNCEIDYLFAVLQTIDFSRFATGMAIPHIYYKDYKNTLIPLPSQDTQKNISRLFRNIDIHIEQNSIQLDNILVLKHGLLQQMFI